MNNFTFDNLVALYVFLLLLFQVKRELPRWLREPIIIRAGAGLRQEGDEDDDDDAVMKLLDEDLRETLRQNKIFHFFPGLLTSIRAHHFSLNVFLFVHSMCVCVCVCVCVSIFCSSRLGKVWGWGDSRPWGRG